MAPVATLHATGADACPVGYGMNKTHVAWFCVGASVALLIFSVRLSSAASPGGVWLTLLMGLVLFLAGVLTLRERPDV